MNSSELAGIESQPVTRDKLLAAHEFIAHLPAQVDLPPLHHFAPGVYVRELTVPVGVAVAGKVHKHEHLCLLASGAAWITSGDQKGLFFGPCIFTSQPGVKRIVYCPDKIVFEDGSEIDGHPATFYTIHPTDETDLDTIEAQTVCDTFEEYEAFQLEHHENLRLAGV